MVDVETVKAWGPMVGGGAVLIAAVLSSWTALRVADRRRDISELAALLDVAKVATDIQDLADVHRNLLIRAAGEAVEDLRAGRQRRVVYDHLGAGVLALFLGGVMLLSGWDAWWPLAVFGVLFIALGLGLVATTRRVARRSAWRKPLGDSDSPVPGAL